MKIKQSDVAVPADVPKNKRAEYVKNYLAMTQGSGHLMLFAGDQKIEHLNGDMYGAGIHADDADPEHLFRIASKAKIGVFATQKGLIAKYGLDYKTVPYLVKLNSKTNLMKEDQKDPYSGSITDVSEVVELKKNSGLKILAVGYTIYLGSEYEDLMLKDASKIVYEAHKNGLLVVLWIYPRGKSVKDEKDAHLIAGATGVGACLGSDFVKVNYPKKEGADSKEIFREAVQAAGNRTHVVCAGGSSTDVYGFLKRLHDQLEVGAAGNATGRNIHQKSLKEAVAMCNAISALTIDNKTVDEAFAIYKKGC
ncbi:MAG: aldolase [Nanoarchaeota archaeon]|nr:aldolase [Nanoarchaeota archaeon]MBU4300890.1 aldolase [Nanoarchaeota archaeon]MBU4451404.1 aldolase [Nanoarchaeota archaeon]MCG2724522.1 aldolase [archaeon]